MKPPEPSQVESKSFLRSKTFYGLLVAGLALLAERSGIKVTDAETQDAASMIFGLIGIGFAWYGRRTATQPVHILKPGGDAQ